MKKLASLGVIAAVAFGVAACEKADPAADFKKFQAWNATQQQLQQQAQVELQQKLAAVKDPATEVAPILEGFSAKVQETVKSLDALDVKSDELKAHKEKTKAVLVLSNEVLTDSIKAMTSQTPEAQKAVQEKTVKLQEAAAALQKADAELSQKYGAAK